MKISGYIYGILCVVSAIDLAKATELMAIGDRVQLPAPPQAKIVIQPKGLLSVVETQSGLDLYPKKVGNVSVIVNGQQNEFLIVTKDTASFYRDVGVFLDSRLGLQANVIRDEVQISGRLHRMRDWLDLSRLAAKSAANYKFAAEVDSDIHDRLTSHFQGLFELMGFPGANLVWSPLPKVILAAGKKDQLDRINTQLKPYGLIAETSESHISVEPLVHVKITVAEVTRNSQKDLGISWPTEATFQLAPKPVSLDILQTTLKAAIASGHAQVLANPSLVAKSGGVAEFLAGGEFPVRVSERGRKDIYWKRHGIYMKIQPKADSLGQLQLDVLAEISMPEASYEGESVPALRTNRVSSQFSLESARTIILSGLVQDYRTSASSGLLGLSDLPVLGRLFRSEAFQKHKSELVIFVTPEIVRPNENFEPKYPEGMKFDAGDRQ